MPAELLDGRATAARYLTEVKAEAARFAAEQGRKARLAVVLVGEDPASQMYVRRIVRGFGDAGLAADAVTLPQDADAASVIARIRALNDDPHVDGILLQLPLPQGLPTDAIVSAIDPEKDVDGVTPTQAGRLLLGQPALVPNTPAGGMALLEAYNIPVSGAEAVVVGRSAIVGKPLALLLLAANATVTVCHTRTRDLGAVTRRADILCVAAGRAGLIDGSMIKPGAVVLDFGVNSTESGVVGDVEAESARQVAGYLTPVPGGTGPMTNVMLMRNTLRAARARQREQPRAPLP
ncbi:MAG: bifunctional 5,10-methylenetetrahydrofolate dehydrogenase/5,10-methenyltetrahydrofolate cyclohydrolase [Dehalococcoidia bacterium]|nr:bifunctional 5,10-methylenetetrahydrofolate dehydrogenase/5,10-methenyltetrahydrofolate cyclohydrolase [Dehalococcoidia bacterium]